MRRIDSSSADEDERKQEKEETMERAIDSGTKVKVLVGDHKGKIGSYQYHCCSGHKITLSNGVNIYLRNDDSFAAIKKYMNTSGSAKLQKDYPELGQGTKRVFHIYPFLGLNTANYDLDGLKKLLTKYFFDYRGLKEDLDQKMGQFDGNIENLDSNFFAGIKVYPPLGFDPWPGDEIELDKVRQLYEYAEAKKIPITCHGGSGGFRAIPLATAVQFAAIPKWEAVLGSYPDLKLNLAHFPMKTRELTRRNRTFQLLMDNKNVYVDISCRATKAEYYEALAKFISRLSEQERTKFMQRLLFGSDFAVNLLWTDSYNAYVSLFSETTTLTPEDKQALCSINPESFLFNT